MQNSNSKTVNIKKILGLTLVGISIIALIAVYAPIKRSKSAVNLLGVFSKTSSAQEIYPMFVCPCCGKPLDPKNICCAMAQERITFIDGLTAGKMSEEEAITAYVKKYGLNSFINEDKKQEFKEKLIAQAPADRPIINISSASLDLGDVSQQKGVVEAFFEIKNEGKNDLVINKLDTSCGCTSASIMFQDKEGPKFAMPGHGANEKIEDWQVSIPSGETAKLKVYYDPNVHQDFRGPATRTVSVFSSDPIDFEKKVQIDLNQVE